MVDFRFKSIIKIGMIGTTNLCYHYIAILSLPETSSLQSRHCKGPVISYSSTATSVHLIRLIMFHTSCFSVYSTSATETSKWDFLLLSSFSHIFATVSSSRCFHASEPIGSARGPLFLAEYAQTFFWFLQHISHFSLYLKNENRTTGTFRMGIIHILLLGLSIPIEFELRNSTKTYTLGKLQVGMWLCLDNRFLFLALFCTELHFSFFNIYLFN